MAVLFGLELPLVLVLAGIGLLIVETLAPTEYLLIVGVALLGAGTVGSLVGPLAGAFPLAVLTLVFGLVTFYVYRDFDPYGSGERATTRTAESLRGSTGRVVERVTASEGRIELDQGGFNPYYQARALDEPIEEGEEVIVTDPGGGNVVTVTSREDLSEDAIDRELRRDAERRRDEAAEADGAAASGDDGTPSDAGEGSTAPDGDAGTDEEFETERTG